MTQRQFIDADEANLPLQNNMQSERQTIFNLLTTFYSPIPCQRTAGIVPLLAAKQQVRKEARTTAWKSRHIFEWKKCQPEACDSLVTRVENSSPGFSLWYTTGTPLWNTSSDRYATCQVKNWIQIVYLRLSKKQQRQKQTNKKCFSSSPAYFWSIPIFHMLQKPKNKISQNNLFLFPVKTFPSRLTNCNKLSWNSYIFFIIWY